jgi:hypothetical protein
MTKNISIEEEKCLISENEKDLIYEMALILKATKRKEEVIYKHNQGNEYKKNTTLNKLCHRRKRFSKWVAF